MQKSQIKFLRKRLANTFLIRYDYKNSNPIKNLNRRISSQVL